MLTAFLFSQLSFTFFPPQNRDFSQVRFFLPPGSTRAQAEAVSAEARRVVETAPEVLQVVERVNVGNGNLNLTLDPERKRTSIEIERSLSPKLSAIADARVNFQSQSGGGPEGGGGGGRDITLHLGGDDPELLFATANKIAEEMEGLGTIRAPRVQGDLVRPEIVIRPRQDLATDLGRDDRRAGADDPPRDAGRHRPEQRQILAQRSPGADPRRACPKPRAATSPRSRICPSRPRPADRCR